MLSRWQLALSISLSMALPTLSHALTVGNIEVQSAVNEPFRAKIPIRNVNVPLNSIKTQMASNNDYVRLGIDPAMAPNLSFRIQDSGNGTAVLWLSSDEPIRSNQVDLLISVGANQDKTLHQMSAALKPPRENVVAEMNAKNYGEIPLIPTQSAPPPMSSAGTQVNLPRVTTDEASIPVAQYEVAREATVSTGINDPIDATASQVATDIEESTSAVTSDSVLPESSSTTVQGSAVTEFENKVVENIQDPEAVTKPAATQTYDNRASRQRQSYNVVRRDTLWSIAKRVSKQHNIPIHEVMLSIQALNKKAFIHNNPNLLREGASISIPRYDEVNELATNFKSTRAGKSSERLLSGSMKPQKKTVKPTRVSKPKVAQAAKKPSAKPKGKKPTTFVAKKSVTRLKKAEMRIVAPSAKGNAQGEVKNARQTVGNGKKLPPQIVTQVKKSRMATIQQRKRINKLNTKLSSYSKKIKLQNAKLAELENRLKQLNKKSTPSG